MKKIIWSILILLGMTLGAYAQEGLWLAKSWDDVDKYDALGVGVCTYTDEVHEWAPAIYGQFSMFGYKDLVRLNIIMAVPPYHLPGEDVYRITLAGGISTLFRDLIGNADIEVGVYYGASAARRPYGIQIGFVWLKDREEHR